MDQVLESKVTPSLAKEAALYVVGFWHLLNADRHSAELCLPPATRVPVAVGCWKMSSVQMVVSARSGEHKLYGLKPYVPCLQQAGEVPASGCQGKQQVGSQGRLTIWASFGCERDLALVRASMVTRDSLAAE